MMRPFSKRLSSERLFSKRLRASLTVEALYVFSLLFLALTAATRFVNREQARCVSGFLLEAAAGEAARSDARFETAALQAEALKERYRPRLETLLPLGDSRFSVWGERTRGGAELRAPSFEARIERQNPHPEDALRLKAELPTETP